MTRVAIIGCGNISRFHGDGYERAGAQIAYACDMQQEAAQRTAERYHAIPCTDYRIVLNDPSVDLVSITTVASAHRKLCIEAMEAGKGVICEKTLSDNPKDSAEIARTADRTGRFCATAYMKRYFPALQQARALLDEMGDIISVHARSWQPWDMWNGPLDPWFLTRPSEVTRRYGGGVLVCAGSHILDLIHWLCGRPSSVCGRLFSREDMDFDMQASAMLWLERGGVVQFEACWHPLRYAGYERNGWDERIEVNTVSGRLDIYTVKWDEPEHNGALLVHQDAASGRVTEYRYPAVNPFHLQITALLQAFTQGGAPSPSAWDGYVVDAIIDAVTRSAHTEQRLPIVWEDRPNGNDQAGQD